MEHITKGHWIFALIFATVFIGYLIWSYRKEVKLNAIHYRGSIFFVFSVVFMAFLLYVFKDYLR